MDDSSVSNSKVGAHAVSSGAHPLPWKAMCDKPNARVRMALVVTHVGTSAIDCTRSGNDYEEDCANARRIVACVNACVGIPTEALEQSRAVLMDSMDNAVAQRDELASTFKFYLPRFDDDTLFLANQREALREMRKALAKP